MSYIQYINDIESGKIVVGNYIRLSVQRFRALEQRQDIYFDYQAVKKVINFVSCCRHFKGKHANKPFLLEPWQQFIIAYIYGFKYRSDNLRVIRKSYIEMSRKNGKTALVAALSLYHLIADTEQGAEVYLAANSRDQVKKAAFPLCYNFSKSLDPKSQVLTTFRDSIEFKLTKSTLKVLAADSTKLDGLDTSFFCMDEYHAASDTRLYEVLNSSTLNRTQPLQIIITTAGFNKNSPCYKEREIAIDVLNGCKSDDSNAIFIYSLDEGDEWDNPINWAKCTPNLGVTVTRQGIENEVNKAKNNSSLEVGVRTKTINEWVDSSRVWIPERYLIDSTKIPVDISSFDPYTPIYIGVDLAASSDLTCLSLLYVDSETDKYFFKNYYYLPQSALNEKENKELYRNWAHHKLINLTSGNVTDYNTITADLMQLSENLNISTIYYDRWNATQWAINSTNEGLPLQEFSQSIGSFNGATKELERLLLNNQVVIDNNDINRFCFRNVELATDTHGNCKPDKKRSKNKIDGVIAMIQALAAYLNRESFTYSGI